jgi:hypothetical protein
MTTLIRDLVPDELWALVEPLLPAPPRPPYGGRHRVFPTATASPRSCTWPGPRSRSGCCRLGSWLWLAREVLASADRVGPGRGVRCPPPQGPRPARDGGPVGLVAGEHRHQERAGQAWGTRWAQIPSIVASLGARSTLVCDGSGLPLTAAVTAANVADVAMLAAVVDDIPAVCTPSGRGRCRPAKIHADKGL